MSQGEEKFVKNLEIADSVYMSVVNEIGIDDNETAYKHLIFELLRRQTKDFLITEIWKNLSKEQIDHLNDYLRQNAKTRSWMSHSDAVMEFSQMYPDLLKKIYPNLSNFFKEFILEFNKIEDSK